MALPEDERTEAYYEVNGGWHQVGIEQKTPLSQESADAILELKRRRKLQTERGEIPPDSK